MRLRSLSSIIALQTIAALSGCGGGGSADEPTQHVDTPTTTPIPNDPRGFWQGTTTNGRVISGVVTKEGDYWLTYALSANNPAIAGFYAGRGTATLTTPPNGTFTSANLRDVNFNAGTTLVGAISVPSNATTNFSARSTLTGALDPVILNVSTFAISGTFPVTATIFGSPLTVPFTVNSGSYDPAAGTGSWNVSGDVSGMGFGVITFDQTFTLNATTGVGNLGVGTNCVGNGIACGGVGPNFNGPINAGGPIVSGLQSWVVTTPQFGSPIFAPTLAGPLPPIVADGLNLTYNNAYETAPSLAAIAGDYDGTAGIGNTLSAPGATFDINSAGAITGSATIGGNTCAYTGIVQVHSATENVYDVTLTVTGNNCTDAGTFAGVATYDGTNQITVTALTTAAERDKGILFIGTK